jgi:hypothetical protein
MREPQNWLPIENSKSEKIAIANFKQEKNINNVDFDFGSKTRVISMLDSLMKKHLTGLIEKDGLPYLCHIINGWGNMRLGKNHTLLDEVAPFVHYNSNKQPFILQRYSEGDFHPWQNFAYCVMAGIDIDTTIGNIDSSLRTVAKNSRFLNIDDTQGHELGHLLFALSYIDPDINGKPFSLQGKSIDITSLMELAIDAHYYGSFEVCRKVHLAEGICAAATKIKGLEKYREYAEILLDGQLDILYSLCIVIQDSAKSLEKVNGSKGRSIYKRLRKKLAIHDFIENHAFYIGHLIELGTLATIMGYTIKKTHWNAMKFACNKLNSILPEFLAHVTFDECFLHFGHYRRATTLLGAIEKARSEGILINESLLPLYTTQLEEVEDLDFVKTPNELLTKKIYRVGEFPNNPNHQFEEIVADYSRGAEKGFEPKGKFNHFRRIIPPNWPRTFHYEFIDHGDKIGIEIHLENSSVEQLKPHVQDLYKPVSELFTEHEVIWDPKWYNNNARLGVLFNKTSQPSLIASSMHKLIASTFSGLDTLAHKYSMVGR